MVKLLIGLLTIVIFTPNQIVCAEVLSGHVEKKDKNKKEFDSGPKLQYGRDRNRTNRPVYGEDRNSQRSIRKPISNLKPINSFPLSFLGRWRSVTKVTSSAVKNVEIGTKMVSEVKFLRKQNGQIVADWLQPGWTESQAYAETWSDKEARVDRTCYFFGDGMQGAWASRSRDHFIMQNLSKMVCKSYIDQYIDGRYLGRYRTISILTRISN